MSHPKLTVLIAAVTLATPATAAAARLSPTWRQARHAILAAAHGAAVTRCRHVRAELQCEAAMDTTVSMNGGPQRAGPPLRYVITAQWRGSRLLVRCDFSQPYAVNVKARS